MDPQSAQAAPFLSLPLISLLPRPLLPPRLLLLLCLDGWVREMDREHGGERPGGRA